MSWLINCIRDKWKIRYNLFFTELLLECLEFCGVISLTDSYFNILIVYFSQVNANGSVMSSDIVGTIRLKTMLSGMPELRLGLNDRVLFALTGRKQQLHCIHCQFHTGESPKGLKFLKEIAKLSLDLSCSNDQMISHKEI